jgi:hypothetical protein
MRMRKPSPQILLNYGMILHALDRSASFDAALKQRSKFAEAHNNQAQDIPRPRSGDCA